MWNNNNNNNNINNDNNNNNNNNNFHVQCQVTWHGEECSGSQFTGVI